MWRGASDVGPFLTGKTMVVAHDDTDHELIAYPISDRTVNWVALARTNPAGELPAGARWNDPATADEVLDHFPGWDFGWLDLDKMIRGAEYVVEYPMVDRDPLPHWGRDRVTLLGDAAHPMYPWAPTADRNPLSTPAPWRWRWPDTPAIPRAGCPRTSPSGSPPHMRWCWPTARCCDLGVTSPRRGFGRRLSPTGGARGHDQSRTRREFNQPLRSSNQST